MMFQCKRTALRSDLLDFRAQRAVQISVHRRPLRKLSALLPSEKQRTVILLLAHTGLRVSSLVTLARDALEIGSDGHPYLRYRNIKLKREAVIPILEQEGMDPKDIQALCSWAERHALSR